MAHGPRYSVKFRRRRKNITDYRKRLRLLLSGKTRLIIRRALNNFTIQFADYDPKGDKILLTVHSKVLEKYFGWKGHRGNIPTAYLTGLLAGLLAKEKGIEEAILDLGRQIPHKGGSLFAALKGVLDAGIKVPHGDEIFPSEDRIEGKHISEYAKLLKEKNPERYKKQFSRYIRIGFDPEKLPEHFNEVKGKILSDYKKLLERAK